MEANRKPTKELFTEYLSTLDEKTRYRCDNNIDRHEVYAYEEKIGKQFIDMTPYEILDMITTFGNDSGDDLGLVWYNTYPSISTMMRSFFDWYNIQYGKQYGVIINPFSAKPLKGKNGIRQKVIEYPKKFSFESIQSVIDKLHNRLDEQRADWCECIILLCYYGFDQSCKDIALIQEHTIDREHCCIGINGHSVQVSEKVIQLLDKVNAMQYMPGQRIDGLMLSWNDSYFKLICRKKESKELQSRSHTYVSNSIIKGLRRMLRDAGSNLTLRSVYYCGAYDALCRMYGEDQAAAMIISEGDGKINEELKSFAIQYNLTARDGTRVKDLLLPYVKGNL